MKNVVRICLFFVITSMLFGCAQNKELMKTNARQRVIIENLSREIERLNAELNRLSQAQNELDRTRMELEQRLQEQMKDGDLTVSMEDRGIVVTIMDKVLFDSGKAEIKNSAAETLKVVANSINSLPDNQMVFVEGHTDSDPIKRSNFKSNWELSTTRATEVVHFFVDTCGVNPERLKASGYGQFQPIASNATSQGKAQNRRVEIIISPRLHKKVVS